MKVTLKLFERTHGLPFTTQAGEHKFLPWVRGFFNHLTIACNLMLPFSRDSTTQLTVEGIEEQ